MLKFLDQPTTADESVSNIDTESDRGTPDTPGTPSDRGTPTFDEIFEVSVPICDGPARGLSQHHYKMFSVHL